ncbi:MAG TPA: DUF1587 domain-containing protein, partial [Opitutaceae bacterium]|nr:DUF1587 domain-containing protein [Opitutaceae bacterium]
MEEVRAHPEIWQSVIDQVALGEMPPEDEKPLALEQKDLLLGWAKGLLAEMATAHAGDPGPVVLRRLSNAEYTYTLRDLMGVTSLDPAKEFPVDGASG